MYFEACNRTVTGLGKHKSPYTSAYVDLTHKCLVFFFVSALYDKHVNSIFVLLNVKRSLLTIPIPLASTPPQVQLDVSLSANQQTHLLPQCLLLMVPVFNLVQVLFTDCSQWLLVMYFLFSIDFPMDSHPILPWPRCWYCHVLRRCQMLFLRSCTL